MLTLARWRLRHVSTIAVFALSAAFLAACASPAPKTSSKKRSKEYFAESEYGVKASPRVTTARSNLKRGGGRDQLGQPYKVRGKMYYPKEDKNYKKVGGASWYGDAFHGRLTANGEIYDMTHLTAAHPTMPLPSYARVTNLENGSSVVVRVNDRGPYHDGRLIDLSRRAAEMLDYTHAGTAKVQVEYVGRAPLDGRDEQYLMASYRPGNRAPDPSDGLPTGVMIAMNGPTPSVGLGSASAPFPGTMTDAVPVPTNPEMVAFGNFILPEFGPLVPERPADTLAPTQLALATMSYADDRVRSAATAFAALDNGMTSADIAQSWKRLNPNGGVDAVSQPYVAVGTFESEAEAKRHARTLSNIGRTAIETSEIDSARLYTVNLYGNGRASIDEMLEAAWSNGASDAMTVRN
ncbi:septal ring lytic transglycosylase RlpA family protein [Pseudaminobacter arsenicus]|uniref:Endolytic peptidoglycan transglycosylase RlpA n=1 Tax=Borborobacter arsenicus TaxID=1851146 RepID=A0A432V1Y2_9HYPH|nr:septal ring lytic transglycosylase RlpA family protein [Pseudaminobacter arsenicus]RUM96180.1 septal ring lytic transglycosylase RlpA family protein [Pseudaminobacter arsenicus]